MFFIFTLLWLQTCLVVHICPGSRIVLIFYVLTRKKKDQFKQPWKYWNDHEQLKNFVTYVTRLGKKVYLDAILSKSNPVNFRLILKNAVFINKAKMMTFRLVTLMLMKLMLTFDLPHTNGESLRHCSNRGTRRSFTQNMRFKESIRNFIQA